MANNQFQQPDIERARDLLSPYLDKEVTAEERAFVEKAMAASPELQHELETLRQTVSLVRALPPRPAPRPFTLSEAEVQPVRPTSGPRRAFPTWLKHWSMLAAMLLGVLAIGGVFLTRQFGNLSAPAEIAFRQEAAAPEAAIAGRQAEEEAAAQSVTEEVLSEALMAEEAATEAPAEEEIPVELADEIAESPTVLAREFETEAEKAVEITADEAANSTMPRAGEGEAEAESKAAGAGSEDEADAVAQNAIAATKLPAPTATALATSAPPPAPVVDQDLPAESRPVEPPQPGLAEGAPAVGGGDTGLSFEQNAISPRPVEIQDLRLQISPGVIQLGGSLEAGPSSPLKATLLRDGEPFDSWADPATLQSRVQPNGQFSLTIRANANRTDQDLLAAEPAHYRITITTLDPTAPVVASTDFDTFSPSTAIEQPTPTFTPRPTATTIATVAAALAPAATPTAAPSPIPAAATDQTSSLQASRVVVSLLAIGGVTLLGLVIWLLIRKQQR